MAGSGLLKPPRLSAESLKRTVSDISFELSKVAAEAEEGMAEMAAAAAALPPISEVEEAKCECCGMAEECTGEYVGRVRAEFGGRVVCGLCAEAVAEEMAKKGGTRRLGRDEALAAHMSDCSRFTRLGRTHPALLQADAIKEILKKTNSNSNSSIRAKSLSPRDYNGKGIQYGNSNSTTANSTSISAGQRIARSSSCIPAIRKEQLD